MGGIVEGIAALKAWFASSAVASAIGGILTNVALSYVIAALSGGRKTTTADTVRDLALPRSLPAKRFVYGETRVYGTPAPVRVKGPILYACMILNSRPSESIETIWLDKRELTLSGDAFDFEAGGGATATEAPFQTFVRVWIGLGDQVAPPAQILDEAPDLFVDSDGWQGCTVLWLRLDVGPNEGRTERWPRVPPEVEVLLRGCKVWDPRDDTQNADDPATWTWSANHALCILDALRQSPVRAYRTDNLLMASFKWSADVSDQLVARNLKDPEPRYTANGVVIFDGAEIEDQLEPMMISAAARFTRLGGRLGLLPAIWRAPVATIDQVLGDDGIEYDWLRPGRDLANVVKVSYVSLERDARMAELLPYEVPGARAADGGAETMIDVELPFCTSPTQAMRVQKIIALRQRAQRQVRATLPPEAFNLVAGSVVTLALPPPFARLSGIFEITGIAPGASPLGSEAEQQGGAGVALRCPAELVETAETVFAWNPGAEEQVIIDGAPFDPWRLGVLTPGALSTTTGPGVALGAQARIRFAFDPSESAAVTDYEWQFRAVGAEYEAGGLVDADVRDGEDKVFGHVNVVDGTSYDVRVRAVAGAALSIWVEITNVEAIGP
jgi:hypothetical protein